MPYLIGTDEAGYGPNYGPLCVSATVWEVADEIAAVDLYKRLRRVVSASVERAGKRKIAWADSKAIYKSGSGLEHLERGVLAALALLDRRPSHWRDLWEIVQSSPCEIESAAASAHPIESAFGRNSLENAPATTAATMPSEPGCAFSELPWHADYSAALPLWMHSDAGPAWMSVAALPDLVDTLRNNLAAAGVRLVDILCRAVFPAEFNAAVQARNKADVLSQATLSLIADALESIPGQAVEVCCDKHGGRDYYLPLLQTQFEDWIEVRGESAAVSRYRFANDRHRVEIGFYVGGERFLPVALASMTAKYVRETAMLPFNQFWCQRVAGLKPTAGYPTDARRFRKQIAAVQQELEIDDRVVWRNR